MNNDTGNHNTGGLANAGLSREVLAQRQEEVKEIVRGRWVWRVIAVLFFIPSIFFMFGPEKRIREALETGDTEAARDAVSKMRTAALIGLPIGIILLIIRINAEF